MREVGRYVRENFDMGALGTGRQTFYERFGWVNWRGPSAVRTSAGTTPTSDDDGYLMVLRTPTTPRLNVAEPISCGWRPGDVW